MTMSEARPGEEAWSWIESGDLEVGGCLVFVRGGRPEQVIEAFGADLGSARMLSAAQLNRGLLFPVFDRAANIVRPWVRVGRTGEWAFGIDQTGPDVIGFYRDVGLRLSAGSDAVVVLWTAKSTSEVEYMADGELVTSFTPEMASVRIGSEPDRFLREMQEAGLIIESPAPSPGRQLDRAERQEPDLDDPLLAAMQMLTLALGIRLPRVVADGPLLTVQRESGRLA
jgi:Family of unknown function (DUF6461)